MWTDWLTFLSSLGAMQGLLLAIFLFFNNKPARYLAVFTLVFSLGLMERLFEQLQQNSFLFWLPDFIGITSFLYGPLLYLYIHSSLKPTIAQAVHKHFLLFYVFCGELVLTILLKVLFNFELGGNFLSLSEIFAFELLFAQLFYYCFKSLFLLHKEKRQHELSFVKWLFYLTSALTFIYLLSFVSTNLMLLGFNFEEVLLSLVQLGCVAVVYSFSYHALMQKNRIEQRKDTQPKYNNSPIIKENKPEYLRKIIDSMEREQLYLDPLLTQNKLSEKLGINRFYISQVINEHLGKSFPDFVNAYRVKKTKTLLESDKGQYYTLLAIAYESGFNSKTSFNSVFKKHTGHTPSAYRKLLLEKARS